MPVKIQSRSPFDFTIKEVEFLCKRLISPKYNTFTDKSSLSTISDLPFMTLTDIWEKFGQHRPGFITIDKEHVKTAGEARAYLIKSILNKASDIFNTGHLEGALQRDKETGELKRTRQFSSTERSISEDGHSILMDTLDSSLPCPEMNACVNEVFDAAEFIHTLELNLMFVQKDSIVDELKNIPSLSEAGLVKLAMYSFGIKYGQVHMDCPLLDEAIQTLWPQSNLPIQGLAVWNSNLNSLKQELIEANANHPMIVKQFMLLALNPTENADDLFSTDTPRESLRKALGHAEAGMSLLKLVSLLHISGKDEFQQLLTSICIEHVDSAMKVFTEKRQNFKDGSNIEKMIEAVGADNLVPSRDTIRQILAPIVYDECFATLSIRKQNSIRKLVRSAGLLMEGLRPLLNETSFTY